MSQIPYITILSHGNYTPLNETFIVPNNIILWQYSTPGQILSLIEAIHIIKEGGKVVEPFYLIDREDGTIYSSKYKAFSILPGKQTKDLLLDFTINEFEGIQMGVQTSAGYTEIPTQRTTIKLSELLMKLSAKLTAEGAQTAVPVIQLSCRSGNYAEAKPDYDELIRAINACKEKDAYENMLYLKRSYNDAFNPKLYFLTKDVHFGEILSCLIERNFPLQNFNTSDDILAFIDSHKPKTGGKRSKSRK